LKKKIIFLLKNNSNLKAMAGDKYVLGKYSIAYNVYKCITMHKYLQLEFYITYIFLIKKNSLKIKHPFDGIYYEEKNISV